MQSVAKEKNEEIPSYKYSLYDKSTHLILPIKIPGIGDATAQSGISQSYMLNDVNKMFSGLQHRMSTEQRAKIQEAYNIFYQRIPPPPNKHSILAELESFIFNEILMNLKKQYPKKSLVQQSDIDRIVILLVEYLKNPSWTSSLAKMSHIPNQGYLPIFDEWQVHVDHKNNVLNEKKEQNNNKSSSSSKTSEESLKVTEVLSSLGIKNYDKACPLCGQTGFYRLKAVQKQRSDEPPSDRHECFHPLHLQHAKSNIW